jgi:hypothetical protein
MGPENLDENLISNWKTTMQFVVVINLGIIVIFIINFLDLIYCLRYYSFVLFKYLKYLIRYVIAINLL